MCLLLAILYPDQFASGNDAEETLTNLWLLDRYLNVAMCAFGVYLFKVASEPGDNVYGPPFGRERNGDWKTALPGTGGALLNPRTMRPAAGIATTAEQIRAAADGIAATSAARGDTSSNGRRKGFGKR